MRVESKKEEKKEASDFKPFQPSGKVFFLAGLVVVSTALFWLAWSNVMNTGIEWNFGTQNIIIIVSAVLAFCLMFGLLALAEVLVTSRFIMLITAVLAAGTCFIFFKPSFWIVVVFLITVLGFLYWRREIRIDMESRSEFLPRRTISSGLRPAITVLLLAVAVSYYSFLVTGPNANAELDESMTGAAAGAVNQVLKTYYQGKYRPDMSLDEFIRNLGFIKVQESAPANFNTGNTELDQVLEEGFAAAETEAVNVARQELLDTFEIQATGDEEMQSVVVKIVRKNIYKYVEPYRSVIPAVLALGLFFLLILFRFFYQELIKGFGYLLFHIMVWTKFIRVEKVKIDAEKITL